MASMSPTISCFTAILSLLLLSTSSGVAATRWTASHAGFIRCFSAHVKHADSQLITPNTTSYDAVFRSSIRNIRLLSNSTKPAAIVTPDAFSDACAAVVCARLHRLGTRVRSGGHDYEGFSYIATAPHRPFIVLDLANLSAVTVNKTEDTAWVQAGATVGDVYYHVAAVSLNLAFPAGICTTIGVGGHLSGGGIGTLMRKYGVSADNIVDAVIVNRHGRMLDRESMGEDLFWAIRGGGAASFGVILAYKIKLVVVPTEVSVFSLPITLDQNGTHLVERWQRIGPELTEDLFTRVIALAVGSGGNRTVTATFQGMYLGPTRYLLGVMRVKFPELGLEARHCMEMTWVNSTLYFDGHFGEDLTSLMDRRLEPKASFKAKSDFVKKPISEKQWGSIWTFLMKAEDEPVVMIMDSWGGILNEIKEDAIAFPHRKGNLYNIQYFMRWTETDEKTGSRHLRWMRELYELMTPFVSKNPRAAYLNYKDIDLGTKLEAWVWGRKYYKGNFERLVKVKTAVDPWNYFGNEQSIPSSYVDNV